MNTIEIRKASKKDAAMILAFIKELAAYEKAPEQVTATVTDIETSLFADSATAQALICTVNGTPAGYAVYFFNYSTWLGQSGIYLEDLYVTPGFRGCGAGTAVLKYLAKLAVENRFERFEWSVLDWNRPAIALYESLGAEAQSEWVRYRLSGKALRDVAGQVDQ